MITTCMRANVPCISRRHFMSSVCMHHTSPTASTSAMTSTLNASTTSSKSNRKASSHRSRILTPNFLEKYIDRPSPFGFNGLGEFVYRRTYSRVKSNGVSEEWWETVARVIEGTFNMQRRWCGELRLGFDELSARRRAHDMYDRMFHMKFLPPGRGLWAMGTDLTEGDHKLHAALNNCGFVSTAHMHENLPNAKSKPFTFLMDAAMLGVGVGFDLRGAEADVVTLTHRVNRNLVLIKGPKEGKDLKKFIIPDSREGWVESVELLLESYFQSTAAIEFDYDNVRAAGLPIKRFGGVSSGPGPLRDLHKGIRDTLDPLIGKPITMTAITDIMNRIGQCVIAGNVRRTAEIAFGPPDSAEYLDLKNYEVNPARAEFGWTSNNSIYSKIGMDYTDPCKRVQINGEPGFAWLENMRRYGRMGDPPNDRDWRAGGGNPCLEQTLESFELCCLVETFPQNHVDFADYAKTLECAMTYAKTVTLGETHWPETNRVLLRNRRIGCSMSGIAQFITARGMHEFHTWCEEGYKVIQKCDEQLSEDFAVPRSIKTTSIKPSGTVSLLAGATAGMHYPTSRFVLRRVRVSKNSDLVVGAKAAGYHVEPAVSDPHSMIIEFPLDYGTQIRSYKDQTMWEQLSLAAFLQKYWADNQVSCTVTFDPEREGPQIQHALDYYQYQLKGISFLPDLPEGAYPQMPLEAITEDKYNLMMSKIRAFDFSKIVAKEPVPEKFCDAHSCETFIDASGPKVVIEED